MTEPCELTAVEARARIGRRQLSPVELLESCIDRIETGEIDFVDDLANVVPAVLTLAMLLAMTSRGPWAKRCRPWPRRTCRS